MNQVNGIFEVEGYPDDGLIVVEAGATLRGRARLLEPAALECRKVMVSIGWETTDRGNAAKNTILPRAERPGAWSSAPEAAVSFEFTVPREGPVSCEGKLIRLRWMLRAEGDVPLRGNPHFLREVVVMPRLWTPDERAAFEAGVWETEKLTSGGICPTSAGPTFAPPPSREDDRGLRRDDDEPRRRVD